MTSTVTIEAQMPDEELAAFLQMMRAWDNARPAVRLAMKIDASGLPVEDLQAIFARLTPPLPLTLLIKRPQ